MVTESAHTSPAMRMDTLTQLGDPVCESCVRATLRYVQKSSFPAEAAHIVFIAL